MTSNLENRINELQTANPLKLEFKFGMSVPTKNDAFSIEKALHNKFKKYKLNGEWFCEEPIKDFLMSDKESKISIKTESSIWDFDRIESW